MPIRAVAAVCVILGDCPQLGLANRELGLGRLFGRDELVAGPAHRSDHLVELEVERPVVAVGAGLDEKHHPERDDRRARVDHQLPRIGKVEHRPAHQPDEDDQHRKRDGDRRPDCRRDPVGEPIEPITSGQRLVRGAGRLRRLGTGRDRTRLTPILRYGHRTGPRHAGAETSGGNAGVPVAG